MLYFRGRSCAIPGHERPRNAHAAPDRQACARRTVMFVLAFAQMGCLPLHGAEELPTAQVLKDYREALKRLESLNAVIRLEGKVREVYYKQDSTDPNRERNYDFSYVASGGQERLAQSFLNPEYVERVFVMGGKRDFVARRSSPRGEYAIDRLNTLPDNYVALVVRRRNAIARSAYSIGEVDLAQAVNSRHFVARKATRVQRDGKTIIKLEFDYKPNVDNQFNSTGWVLLDTDKSWVVVEYEVQNTAPPIPSFLEVAAGSSRYGSDGVAFPLPVELKHTERDPRSAVGLPRYSIEFRAELGSHERVSSEQFSLSSFGLGDLDRPPGQPSHHFAYWAFGFGTVTLVASLVLRRLGRRS